MAAERPTEWKAHENGIRENILTYWKEYKAEENRFAAEITRCGGAGTPAGGHAKKEHDKAHAIVEDLKTLGATMGLNLESTQINVPVFVTDRDKKNWQSDKTARNTEAIAELANPDVGEESKKDLDDLNSHRKELATIRVKYSSGRMQKFIIDAQQSVGGRISAAEKAESAEPTGPSASA